MDGGNSYRQQALQEILGAEKLLAKRVTLRWLEEARREGFRRAYRAVYVLRQQDSGRRTGRRSLEDTLRLARLAVEAANELLEVVEWGPGRRRLRLKPAREP